jgi:hypothetical protein
MLEIIIFFFYVFSFYFLDENKEPRNIGLSMIPGHHIITIEVDEPHIS